MADLIDRIAGTGIDERPKINLHRFMGAERLYAFGEWSRAEIATEFDLQGDEATQAGQLADLIDDELKAADKALYILRVESVCMCLEDGNDRLYHNPDGTVNRTQVYEDLLITG
jgi:hypothetical protein